MIRIYSNNKEFIELKTFEEVVPVMGNSIWMDLLTPGIDEIRYIEKTFTKIFRINSTKNYVLIDE